MKKNSLSGPKLFPHTLRNPLYHWTHLELQRYFGIDESVNPQTASSIYRKSNELLQHDELSVHGMLRKNEGGGRLYHR